MLFALKNDNCDLLYRCFVRLEKRSSFCLTQFPSHWFGQKFCIYPSYYPRIALACSLKTSLAWIKMWTLLISGFTELTVNQQRHIPHNVKIHHFKTYLSGYTTQIDFQNPRCSSMSVNHSPIPQEDHVGTTSVPLWSLGLLCSSKKQKLSVCKHM